MSTEKAIEIIVQHYESKLKKAYREVDKVSDEQVERETVIFNFINEKLGYEDGVLAVAKLIDAIPHIECEHYVEMVELEDWTRRPK